MTRFWRWWLKAYGWELATDFPYHIKKAVIAVAPHTSNTDFLLGLAVRSVLDLQHIRYLGKEELFRPPFGFVFRKLGGTPVNRKSSTNMVQQVVEQFRAHDEFLLAMSPEGTRSRVDRLRTGFYHIARQAGVPIILVAFNYGKKLVHFAPPFYPGTNEEEDLRQIIVFFAGVQGKVPQNGMMHLLGEGQTGL